MMVTMVKWRFCAENHIWHRNPTAIFSQSVVFQTVSCHFLALELQKCLFSRNTENLKYAHKSGLLQHRSSIKLTRCHEELTSAHTYKVSSASVPVRIAASSNSYFVFLYIFHSLSACWIPIFHFIGNAEKWILWIHGNNANCIVLIEFYALILFSEF